MTLTEAFAAFGVKSRDRRKSWSAISDDKKTVVLSLWSDQFTWATTPIQYNSGSQPDGLQKFGRRERTDHLAHVRRNCEGIFRVAIVMPIDPEHSETKPKSWEPKLDWLLRLVDFNEQTGEFKAEVEVQSKPG